MGSTQSCFKQQNLNQNEFQIPVIAKSNFIQIHPTRQNYLIEPIHNLGEKQESLEELELILQQSNPCISFNYTATFHSNSNKKGSSQERQNISQILQPNHQEQQQNYKVNNKDNQNQNPQQILKQLEQKQEAKTNNQSQKRKSLSRSLSNFKQQKCDWKDDQQNKYKDSDCNTITANKCFLS